ncbi:MAG: right-handed parallel beta-helix repeat-containing protein [Candidatus Omnitrophica bacterium]|nr:right-handed parallel beta-helix repeat-containing protein [Candidatus Omnitrophota bacterium]
MRILLVRVSIYLVFVISFFCQEFGTFAEEGQKGYQPSRARFSTQVSTEDRWIFYTDYLCPIRYSQDENTLIFFNPKAAYSLPASEELNLGLGFRHIFSGEYILGFHIFYDKKKSVNQVWHSQRGYGFEFLSEKLDFRFNYYDPTRGPKEIDTTYGLGATSLVSFQNLEEPLEGFDFEFGIPVVPKKLNTRIYLGGFIYDSTLTHNVEGVRLRSETDINDWLSLDLTYNQDVRGESEFVGGFRINIPLEFGKLFDKKNPFETKKRSHIKDRLFDRVVRDIDIQSSGSVIQRQQRNDVEIIYVDNSNNTGTEDGTKTNPHNTLAEAFLDGRYDANKYIYIFRGDGTSTGYTGNYTLADGVVLWGSGYNGGYQGIPNSGYPILAPIGGNDAVTLGNNNTVMGLQIQSAPRYGIYASNKTGGKIIQNRILSNVDDGIYIEANAGTSSNFTILRNNVSSSTAGDGIQIYALGGGTATDFDIANNTCSGNSDKGVEILINDGFVSDINISDNTFSGNGGWAVLGVVTGSGTGSDITVIRNIGVTDGIAFAGNGGSWSDITIAYNNLSDSHVSGIEIESNGVDFSNVAILNNTLSGNWYHGLYFDTDHASAVNFSDFTVSGNVVINNFGDGINFDTRNDVFSDFTFSGNIITGSTDDGIGLDELAGSTYTNINFGDASTGIGGLNSIYNNSGKSIENNSGTDNIKAEKNYWGGGAATTGGPNSVDTTPYLVLDPN